MAFVDVFAKDSTDGKLDEELGSKILRELKRFTDSQKSNPCKVIPHGETR